MNHFYALLFSILTLPALAQKHIVPEPFRSPGTLHPIPLAYTGRLPDIYLPGDSIKKLHVRTHIVEVISFKSVSTNDMIDLLRQKAQAQGLDGVALQQLVTLIPVPDGLSYSLVGIGLKYLDNISYIDTILRQRVITRYLPNGLQDKTALLDFDWHGNLLTSMNSEDVRFYADSMSMFDLNLLYNRLANIYDYQIEDPPVQRIVSVPNWPDKIVHIITEGVQQIDFLLSSSKSRLEQVKTRKVKITPIYTDDRLTGAIVTGKGKKEKPLYYIYYKYEALGQITSERWEKIINGKRTLWLEVENRFFEADPVLILKLAKGISKSF